MYTSNDYPCDWLLGFLFLIIKLGTGLFWELCWPAALFIALGFSELNFGPKAAFRSPDVPFALLFEAVEERKWGSIAVVEIDLASSEETGVLSFFALYYLLGHQATEWCRIVIMSQRSFLTYQRNTHDDK